MKRYISLVLLALATIGMLAGCNTMRGLGQDVEKAGEAIEDKAVEEQND